MLKNSARNSVENRSVIGKRLKSEKSRRWKPGPSIWPGLDPRAAAPCRGMQPETEVGSGAITPVLSESWQGCANAAGLLIQNGRLTVSPVGMCDLIPRCGLCPETRTSLHPGPETVPDGQPKFTG